MHRVIVVALCALIAAPDLAAAETQAAAGDYLGRWNILIANPGDSFPSAWLSLEQADNRLSGSLVWKWGDVTPLDEAVVEAGVLAFRRRNERFRATLVDGELRGYLLGEKEAKLAFTGRRAPEMCDVAGTWRIWPAEDPDAPPSIVRLSQDGGAITGTATDADGNVYTLVDAALDGYVLNVKVAPPGGGRPGAAARIEVRGDVMAGTVTFLRAGGAQTGPIAGARERVWGEPVTLIAPDSLEGWGPRDPKGKFNWKVAGGVLENLPPTVDIVSRHRFRDFRMQLQYKVAQGANSGIYLRGRYELQILGNRNVHPQGNMAVYSRLPPARNPMRDFDQWQSIDVTFIGRWVTVVLNGEVVHDNQYLPGVTGGAIDPWEDEPGPIMLQGDHGKILFRNIVITPAK